MKRIILIFLLFFPLLLISQSQIELYLSPDISYRAVRNTDFRNNESAKLNYHFQLNYIENISSNWALKIGVGFAQLGYKNRISNLVFPGQVLTEQPTSDPLAPNNIEFRYDYQFFEIPLSMQYYFSKKRWTPFIEFGLSVMYYIQSIDQYFLDDKKRSVEKFRDENFINQIQLASIISLGITYKINDKWKTFFQPNFRYNLTKHADSSVREHLWSGGLALGMRMNLK